MAPCSSQRAPVVVVSQPRKRAARAIGTLDRGQWKSDLKWMVRAQLPYHHPLKFSASGPALREVFDRGERARRALQKHGLQETVTKEINSEIGTDTQQEHASRVGHAKARLARLQREVEEAAKELAEARHDELAYLRASNATKSGAS
jgi:hypothetical protein